MIICFNKSSELKIKIPQSSCFFNWNFLGQNKKAWTYCVKLTIDYVATQTLWDWLFFYLRRIKISTLTRCCCRWYISGVLNRAKINFNKLPGFLLYVVESRLIFVRLMQLRNKRHSSLHYGHLISLNSETTINILHKQIHKYNNCIQRNIKKNPRTAQTKRPWICVRK